MLSKRIRFIVIIVTCSLAGIFLLQAYWLYNSYLLSAKQFENTTQEVIQNLQTNHILTEFAPDKNMPATDLASSQTAAAMLNQILKYAPHRVPLDSLNLPALQKKGKPMINTSIVYAYSNTPGSTSNHKNSLPKQKIMNITAGSYKYSKKEMIAFEKNIRHELGTLLKNKDINTPFAFMIYNTDGKGDRYISDSTLFSQSKEKPLKAVIGLSKPYQLQIKISSHLPYIFKQMQWVLLASVLMIGVTVWAYIYMLSTIFQQKKLSEIKNDFINNMTHEFKTPIATVTLAVEAMKSFDVMEKPEQAREYLDICLHELKRISLMIEKVLRIAVFERNEFHISLKKTNIGKLINDVAANMRPQLEQKEAKLSIQAIGGKIEAMVDADHFSSVIYNLIDNSLKYAAKTPEISITYGKDPAEHNLVITINDNGIGIPEEYHLKIFERFFRVPTGNIHNVKGFGLGLNYVTAIIKKHNGRIELKSIVHKGSSFIITLPIDNGSISN